MRRGRRVLGVLRDSAVIFLIVYAFFWNVGTYPGKESYMPAKYMWIGQADWLVSTV